MQVLAAAREPIERQQAKETRGFGGRRIGFAADEAEYARMVEADQRLFELACRALRRTADPLERRWP